MTETDRWGNGISPICSVAAPKQAEVASPHAPAKKDTLLLSEKAKDLAALKAGKSFSEEASESMMDKLREEAE